MSSQSLVVFAFVSSRRDLIFSSRFRPQVECQHDGSECVSTSSHDSILFFRES